MWNTAKELWRYFLFRLNPYRRLDAAAGGALARLLSPLAPQRAEGVAKIRVGGPHDGGYVMLDDFRGIMGAYSLGIGPEVSWDLGVAARGVPVWQYDPTVSGPPVHHPLFRFEPWRIGSHDDVDRDRVSLPGLIARNGHEKADLILKMDIEGAEWAVLAGIDPDRLRVFRQIVLEFHALDRAIEADRRPVAEAALAHLTRHHQVVHVHGNNLSRIVVAGDLRVTESIEVTLARRDAYRFAPTDETFPGPQDRPNSRIFRDVELGRFRFGS